MQLHIWSNLAEFKEHLEPWVFHLGRWNSNDKKKLIKAGESMKYFVALPIFDSQLPRSMRRPRPCICSDGGDVFYRRICAAERGGKRKTSISWRFLRRLWGLSISACIPELSSQARSSTFRCPFLFIIHIYSALTDILIFDIKTSGRNAKMDSTRAAVGMLCFLIVLARELADVCTLSVGGWEKTPNQRERAESHRTEDQDSVDLTGLDRNLF